MLDASEGMPATSQPSVGDFAKVYRRLVASDSDILPVHMTSGMSRTYNAALAGTAMVLSANVNSTYIYTILTD